MKLFIFAVSGLLILYSINVSAESGDIPINLSVAREADRNHRHIYASLGFFAIDTQATRTIEPYLRAELFMYSDDSFPKDVNFAGAALGGGVYLNYPLAPYIGINGLLGTGEICDQNNLCHDKGIVGIAPEVGLFLNLSERYNAQVFARKYYLSENLRSFNAIGLSFTFEFREKWQKSIQKRSPQVGEYNNVIIE